MCFLSLPLSLLISLSISLSIYLSLSLSLSVVVLRLLLQGLAIANETGPFQHVMTTFIKESPAVKAKQTRALVPYLLPTARRGPTKHLEVTFKERCRRNRDDKTMRACSAPCITFQCTVLGVVSCDLMMMMKKKKSFLLCWIQLEPIGSCRTPHPSTLELRALSNLFALLLLTTTLCRACRQSQC